MGNYSALLLDSLNLLYRLREHTEHATLLSSKYVYRTLAKKYIEYVQTLMTNYLAEAGTVYLLFDNPTSRLDLQKSFYYAARKHIYPKYKEQRAKDCKEFYNTLDLLRYYYLTNTSQYACSQVQNLEADDLVKPILTNFCSGPESRSLLVTNDYDWTRYLSSSVDWLPHLEGQPETMELFAEKMGFIPTEASVIIYKSLYGDPSDNIAKIISKTEKTYADFLDILSSSPSPDSLITKSHNSDACKKSVILTAIKENQRQYKINIQLTSSIPISDKHIKLVTVHGRNSQVITDAVEVALGLKNEKKEFVFGRIKSPKQ